MIVCMNSANSFYTQTKEVHGDSDLQLAAVARRARPEARSEYLSTDTLDVIPGFVALSESVGQKTSAALG